ncbi:MAG: tRNA preQ1(34) S-adenosylmethionine ribosyltransferase-isomerase QueA [Rickettsiales bacterium]|nr:tRNA preQ1(34) S-adenosylmethionine ribosyltransferase-isomerase QueA [Rickettsiales bacterium]
MRLSDFDYSLPEELIAQEPASPRDASRLLAVSSLGELTDSTIRQLPDFLRPDDVLVFNNTKVIPAQLYGKKGEAVIGITLLKQERGSVWECFAKPARKLSVGDILEFGTSLEAEALSKNESGTVVLKFNKADAEFYSALDEIGQMPLPPYIKRAEKDDLDFLNYQTLHAKEPGAVAAPTAGLHFSEALMAEVHAKGVEVQHVTLHVGGGTFLPVRVEDLSEHQMHSEWMQMNEATAIALNKAKAEGRRIVSVGTTALRCLESAADEAGMLHAQHRETDIFITPGYQFRAVDALLTNFHLPKSTLLMLVSAFSGVDAIRQAYAHAVAQKYRFFSYGDACFLECA